MQIADGSYPLPDRPGGSGARRIWNTPVILASGISAGTAVAGDFTTRSIGVATRGPIQLQWNPFSKDTTNETILRVEGRFPQSSPALALSQWQHLLESRPQIGRCLRSGSVQSHSPSTHNP